MSDFGRIDRIELDRYITKDQPDIDEDEIEIESEFDIGQEVIWFRHFPASWGLYKPTCVILQTKGDIAIIAIDGIGRIPVKTENLRARS